MLVVPGGCSEPDHWRKEKDHRRKEQDHQRKELDYRRKELDYQRKEQDHQRKELDYRRKEQDHKRKEQDQEPDHRRHEKLDLRRRTKESDHRLHLSHSSTERMILNLQYKIGIDLIPSWNDENYVKSVERKTLNESVIVIGRGGIQTKALST